MDKIKYITTELVTGYNAPDEPNININPDTIIETTGNFDEYSIEFRIVESDRIFSLSRETLVHDVGEANYYANYFSMPKGIKKL